MVSLLLAMIYIAFISLGLPDSLLGSAWPMIHQDLGVAVSNAGLISMIIAAGTIISSVLSDQLTKQLGTGLVTTCSVALTSMALLGFSFSHSFGMLCLWAIPYGLGAGSVDASLNNYVALHYASRHMSWLHCMWGVGATLGPYIMGYALQGGLGWNMGYRIVGCLQVGLTLILLLSKRLWKQHTESVPQTSGISHQKAVPLKTMFSIPGAKAVMLTFFCYCALEQTASLWLSSYLVYYRQISMDVAASWASMFFLGITVGRGFSGFLTMRFQDSQMIRGGLIVVAIGIGCLLLAPSNIISLMGLILLGMGCAPIYPCIIHSTPVLFGSEHSQAMIGLQMASAYVGILIMPVLFGVLAKAIHVSLLPWYLLVLLVLMFVLYEQCMKHVRCDKSSHQIG